MESSPAEDRRPALALRAAQMYYMQDQTMEAIARELAMSRSSVSRLLSHARDTGLVEIRVHSPLERGSLLERRIGERYRVTAHVVPMPQVIPDVDRLDRVATTAGRLVSSFVDSNDVIGVAWGSTMNAVGRHLARKDVRNTVVVQMNGAGNMHTTGIDYASAILQQFGEAFGSQVQEFAVPAFFDDPATRDALWRERSVRRVLGIQGRMDMAIFSLGSPFSGVPSHVYIGGYLEPRDFKSLTADRAIGDVATVFFRSDGSSHGIALNARASGPDLARLARVARRVCVVSGVQKLPALRGALAAGLITDLILDEGLATELLESA